MGVIKKRSTLIVFVLHDSQTLPYYMNTIERIVLLDVAEIVDEIENTTPHDTCMVYSPTCSKTTRR